jgi:hypothetical protein
MRARCAKSYSGRKHMSRDTWGRRRRVLLRTIESRDGSILSSCSTLAALSTSASVSRVRWSRICVGLLLAMMAWRLRGASQRRRLLCVTALQMPQPRCQRRRVNASDRQSSVIRLPDGGLRIGVVVVFAARAWHQLCTGRRARRRLAADKNSQMDTTYKASAAERAADTAPERRRRRRQRQQQQQQRTGRCGDARASPPLVNPLAWRLTECEWWARRLSSAESEPAASVRNQRRSAATGRATGAANPWWSGGRLPI